MMGLNIAIGILAALLAVLGGIVSAHPPSNLKHKRLFVAVFIMSGFAAIVLIIVQAVKTDRAATQAEDEQKQMAQKQNELIDKVNSESNDLSSANSLLEQSRIDQANIKGQLGALEMVAGKINQNSGTGMQALVGAINKVADSGVVGKSAFEKMSDDELRAAIRKWGDSGLEFNSKHDTDSQRMVDQLFDEQLRATTNDDRAKAMQKLRDALMRDTDEFRSQFQARFVADGLAFREELRRRLGPLPETEPGGLEQPLALDGNINTVSIMATVSYLEWLSKKLP